MRVFTARQRGVMVALVLSLSAAPSFASGLITRHEAATASPTESGRVAASFTQVHQEGQEVSLSMAFASLPGAIYTAENLPPGLSIDANSGWITGALSPNAAGRYQVRVQGKTTERLEWQSFTWFVVKSHVPQVTSPGFLLHKAGEQISVAIEAHEPSGRPLAFKAINLPRGLSIDEGTGVISGQLEAHDALTQYQVTVMASDAHSTGGAVFSWAIAPQP